MNNIKKEDGEKREFETGANKQASAGKGTPVLFPGDAYTEVCKHFEDGANHYEARNWEKGIPLGELINSLERHIADEKMGDTSERHDRAIAWNAIVYLATKIRIKNGILPKSLDDMPRYPKLRRNGVLISPEIVEQAKAECGVRGDRAKHAVVAVTEKELESIMSEPVKPTTAEECYNTKLIKAKLTNVKMMKYCNCGTGVQPVKTKRIYMSHSIRGRAGVDATILQMQRNNQLAVAAGEKLRKLMPDYDVYVPGDHDELVIIGFEKGYLDEQKILDIDCEIVSKCDMIVAYTPDGYLSRGMTTELRHALSIRPIPKMRVKFFDGENKQYSLSLFRECYPEEYKKLI